MAEEQKVLNLLIVWRGKELNLEINSNSTLKELGEELLVLTNVRPQTLRLLVPRSTKGSNLFSPFSVEHSSLSLQEINMLEGKSIRMMGVFEDEIEEVSQNNSKPDLRILGFEEEEKRARRLLVSNLQSSLKLPQGNYIFCDFRTLHIPGIELNPPPSEALRIMHKLAGDPGVVAIMNKHRWRVGLMTEMPPIGYVGISPKCILGFNKNHGEEISLRLRTDDLKGFRKYESIKKTLLHELAHMVYSEHDADFYALDRQLNQEAASLDWTKSKSHTLSGIKRSEFYDDGYLTGNVRTTVKLGGNSANLLVSARKASVGAAYGRFSNAPKTVQSDPGGSAIKATVKVEIPMERVGIRSGPSNHKLEEPDPDDMEGRFQPELDDSASNALHHVASKESDLDDFEHVKVVIPFNCTTSNQPHPGHHESKELGEILGEPDPDDSQAAPMVEDIPVQKESLEEPDPDDSTSKEGEPDPDDAMNVADLDKQETKDVGFVGEAEASHKQSNSSDQDRMNCLKNIDSSSHGSLTAEVHQLDNEALGVVTEPVSVVCARLQKAVDKIRLEVTPVEAVSVLQTLFKIIRNVIEHPEELKFRRLRKANPVFQKNVASYNAAMEVLSIVGFHEDVVFDEIGRSESYLVLKRNDPGLLWLAKSSLEMSVASVA